MKKSLRETVCRQAARGETASVAKACEILNLLDQRNTTLRLSDIARLTGINKATAYRILSTLHKHNMVGKSAVGEYVSALQRRTPSAVRIGYAAQSDEFSFSRAVTEGIVASAKKAGIDLVVLDNAYSPTVALQNAATMIRESVLLVIEFQTVASVAGLISAKLQEKHLPMIAIEIPHPNAVYFGANNTQAGLIAGRHLGRWAVENWHGNVDELLLLGLPMAGSLPASRLTGTLLGLREVLPDIDDSNVRLLNGNGQYAASHQAVCQYLKGCTKRRILVGAVNDPSALGALHAFRDAGREKHCAVVGQNASCEAVTEMRRPSTKLIGSVGYFPEKYGEQVIELAMNMIDRKRVPASNFVKHHLITPANVQSYYPIPRRKRAEVDEP